MPRRIPPGTSPDGLPNASTTLRATSSRPGIRPSVITTRAVPRARRIASTGSTPAAAKRADLEPPRRTRRTRECDERRDVEILERAAPLVGRGARDPSNPADPCQPATEHFHLQAVENDRPLRHPGCRLEIGERDAEHAPLARAHRNLELQRDHRRRRRTLAPPATPDRGHPRASRPQGRPSAHRGRASAPRW